MARSTDWKAFAVLSILLIFIYICIFGLIGALLEYSVIVELGFGDIPEIMLTANMEQAIFVAVWQKIQIAFFICLFAPLLVAYLITTD